MGSSGENCTDKIKLTSKQVVKRLKKLGGIEMEVKINKKDAKIIFDKYGANQLYVNNILLSTLKTTNNNNITNFLTFNDALFFARVALKSKRLSFSIKDNL